MHAKLVPGAKHNESSPTSGAGQLYSRSISQERPPSTSARAFCRHHKCALRARWTCAARRARQLGGVTLASTALAHPTSVGLAGASWLMRELKVCCRPNPAHTTSLNAKSPAPRPLRICFRCAGVGRIRTAWQDAEQGSSMGCQAAVVVHAPWLTAVAVRVPALHDDCCCGAQSGLCGVAAGHRTGHCMLLNYCTPALALLYGCAVRLPPKSICNNGCVG